MEDAVEAASEVRNVKPDFTLEKFAKTQPYKDPEILEQMINMLRKTGLQ
jgi:hypothetical protein